LCRNPVREKRKEKANAKIYKRMFLTRPNFLPADGSSRPIRWTLVVSSSLHHILQEWSSQYALEGEGRLNGKGPRQWHKKGFPSHWLSVHLLATHSKRRGNKGASYQVAKKPGEAKVSIEKIYVFLPDVTLSIAEEGPSWKSG